MVTVWPLFTYLLIFDWLFGFVTGMVLFVICNLAGAPTGVQAAGMLVGAVVWIATWLRTSIQFTADDLVVTMLLRPTASPGLTSLASRCWTCGTPTAAG